MHLKHNDTELIRGLSKGGLSEEKLSEIESDYEAYVSSGIRLIPVSKEVIRLTTPLIKRNKLGAIDALHVSSALTCADVMVSSDRHLLKNSLAEDLKNSITVIRPKQAHF